MGEETTVFVATWRIVRKVEPIPLEILPEQLGRQRMVLGPILGVTVGTLEGASNWIARFPVAELHGRPGDAWRYLAEVHGETSDCDLLAMVSPSPISRRIGGVKRPSGRARWGRGDGGASIDSYFPHP